MLYRGEREKERLLSWKNLTINMACEMCGSKNERYIGMIEGSQMAVCQKCISYGKKIREIVETPVKTKNKSSQIEKTVGVNPNYSKLIREYREKEKLNHEDFSKKLGEKISVIKKIESGKQELPMHLAKKIKRILGIDLLIEETHTTFEQGKQKDSGVLTLGDFIKIRKKN